MPNGVSPSHSESEESNSRVRWMDSGVAPEESCAPLGGTGDGNS